MTLRVRIQAITPADAASMLGAAARPVNWADDYPTADDLEVAGHLASGTFAFAATESPWGPWQVIDCSDGAVIGGAGFHGPPDEHGVAEIGYNIVPSRRGRGLATAAVLLLIDVAGGAGARTLTAGTDPVNVPSQRVLERSGFAVVERRVGEVRWSRPMSSPSESA